MSRKVKCSADEFGNVLEGVIKQYSDEVVRAMPDAVKEAAKIGLKALKSNADSAVGGTRYKKSFAMKQTGSGSVKTEYTLYSKRYRVAHLLEHGHTIKNQHGTYGISPVHPHWAPAEETAIEALEEKIQAKIEEVGS